MQTLALLQRAPHDGDVQVPTRGSHLEPQGRRKNRKVVP
jgi:hypothetical protein